MFSNNTSEVSPSYSIVVTPFERYIICEKNNSIIDMKKKAIKANVNMNTLVVVSCHP